MERIRDIEPIQQENQLKIAYNEALQAEDTNRSEMLKAQLVNLYVFHGENFKMSARPNKQMARNYLQKALRLSPKHAVANYRLAHLYYREHLFSLAVFYFERALKTGELNDTQKMLSYMFLSNCGFQIAKQALERKQELEGNCELEIDEDKVEQYEQEIFLTEPESLERLRYRIVTPDEKRIVSEERYYSYLDENSPETIYFILSDEGMYIKYEGELRRLEVNKFWIAYVILKNDKWTGNTTILNIFRNSLTYHVDIHPDNIRQHLSGLRRVLPFWDSIIEMKQEHRHVLRRRKKGLTYCILCRASDLLLDE
ncbi:hypothetical protein LC040_07585 [Bacillus tianshenii]|nr:hypothetical protein LC040_07585 [Bacillus tianshenii]